MWRVLRHLDGLALAHVAARSLLPPSRAFKTWGPNSCSLMLCAMPPWQDYAPVAISHYKRASSPSWMKAWQVALQEASARADCLRAHPCDALWHVVMRLLAWSGCTTSGVEQTFAVSDWLVPKRRRRMTTDKQEDELVLAKDDEARPAT